MTSTLPKPFIFVLMPFDPAFDDVYQLGIKKACEAAGAYAERVDEQIFHETILQRVYNQIAKADLIIAEMSGRNANVFYETGYAHALGKPVILLTRQASDIPFDLKHYPHIIYEGRIVDLASDLEKRVRHALERRPAIVALETAVEVQVNDIPVIGEPTIIFEVPEHRIGFEVPIDVNNAALRNLRTLTYQVALVTPRLFARARIEPDFYANSIVIGTDRALHYSPQTMNLLPGAWDKITITPLARNTALTNDDMFEFAVRIFTEAGYVDFPFRVHIKLVK